jgi:hypothetical protein
MKGLRSLIAKGLHYQKAVKSNRVLGDFHNIYARVNPTDFKP